MMTGEGEDGFPAEVEAAGWKANQRKGWEGLSKCQYIAYRTDQSRELSVAFVLPKIGQDGLLKSRPAPHYGLEPLSAM